MAESLAVDLDTMEAEEPYVSSEDEDFDPSTENADGNISSSSEDEGADTVAPVSVGHRPKTATKRKRPKKELEAEDLGFENSGDEAMIRKGTKKRRKGGLADDDSGGEGGFVKTRSMRAMQEEEQTKPLASAEGATIDVDALWTMMNLGEDPITSPASTAVDNAVSDIQAAIWDTDNMAAIANAVPQEVKAPSAKSYHKELITIPFPRMVDGTISQAYKTVSRSSDEAKKYLQTHAAAPALPRSIPHRRVSRWDPNPEGIIRGLPADMVQTDGKIVLLDVHKTERLKVIEKSHLSDWPRPANVPIKWEYNWRKPKEAGLVKKWKVVPSKDQRMNVIDKSKLDWEMHVEQEGDREELVQAAKAKGAYLDKVEFLGRTEANKEEELRIARRK